MTPTTLPSTVSVVPRPPLPAGPDLARRRWSTPRWLVLLGAVASLLAVGLGVFVGTTAAAVGGGFDVIGGRAAPQVRVSSDLYFALSDLDAQAANVLLAGNDTAMAADRAAALATYEQRRTQANSDLDSDGCFPDDPRRNGQQRVNRLRASGCGVLWLSTSNTDEPLDGVTVHRLTDPATTAQAIGRAATAAPGRLAGRRTDGKAAAAASAPGARLRAGRFSGRLRTFRGYSLPLVLVSGRHTVPLVAGVIHSRLDSVEGEVVVVGAPRGKLAATMLGLDARIRPSSCKVRRAKRIERSDRRVYRPSRARDG
jgi:hypothetical protein